MTNDQRQMDYGEYLKRILVIVSIAPDYDYRTLSIWMHRPLPKQVNEPIRKKSTSNQILVACFSERLKVAQLVVNDGPQSLLLFFFFFFI